MATFNIWTIGCQMNTSDARKLSEELEEQGFRETEKARSADLVVLYSCMVRQHAEDKVRSKLGELRLLKREKPSTRIAVAGCVGDVEAWQKKYPFVDFFLAPGQDMTIKDNWPTWWSSTSSTGSSRRTPPACRASPRASRCTRDATATAPSASCRPRAAASARGPPTTSSARSQALIQRGTREVVLLSQIAERYGRDLRRASSLADLLQRLNDEADGLQRIRFLTSYPADFHPDLIEAVATLPKVMEDINLPLQSGDDEMLKRMRRGYTYGFYCELVARMRERIPNLSLADGHHRRVPRRDRGAVPEHPQGAGRDQVRRGPHRGLLDADRHAAAITRISYRSKRRSGASTRSRRSRRRSRPRGTRRCSIRPSKC